ncbi:longevity assurance proteins LAG1/LAC1 [Cucurbitaria berberidis CBS 394.84]|uniref:Longevity assurance proteins LAG1/LAC1 n=1 Tax=Cucurbitaria berberidis CBS 394.84 TaxID=1168544 RepID=A0A9P4GPG5_9PLEO|nr:longevity assurance proteins LAG1/LAC1 [Cucurbitaria berberidis CBS 394.84]KAF1849179.1 longevity assurance proteins LAG1/LAC1 [Cucurbitaria berberidis CBS 394.84]
MATTTTLPNGNGALSSAHAADVHEQKVAVTPKRRKTQPKKVNDEGLLASLCTLVCEHQIGISVNLISLLLLTHMFFPRARSRTTRFLQMSYYNPETNKYACGTDDLPFVILWTVIFTGLRAAIMEYLLDPLARLGGIKTKKGLDRFKEQAWLIVYCTGSWSLGMYIIYHSEFWFNLHGIWEGWPFREVDGLFKWYYLVQWGFWIQQILVVNIEEKRKDYAQMFTHHIFTVALLFLSYGYYHMRVGIVILTIMDFVDIILPTAKLLKYMGYTTVCDIAFGIFVISWFVTRHIFYMMVCWSIYADAPVDMAPGCYISDSSANQTQFVPMSDSAAFEALGGNNIWGNLLKAYTDRNGPICWNPSFRYYFLALLLTLQVICCIWFGTIAKIVYKVLSGSSADDVRSDDEGDDEEIEEDNTRTIFNAVTVCSESGMSAMTPKEEEVGVDGLTFAKMNATSQRRQVRRESSRASGISIPGHGDRKELLGRIGCDKPS